MDENKSKKAESVLATKPAVQLKIWPRRGFFDETAFWSRSWAAWFSDQDEAVNPPADISETDREVIVRVDLPGVEPREVKIEANADSLRLWGEVSDREGEKNESYCQTERGWGKFDQIYALPAPVDPRLARATARWGTITVRLAKAPFERPETVPIKIQ